MPLAPASVSLCLACSASLPPRTEESKVFHTACCSRPICPTCVAANPRLTRYNPCLLCLAGVSAVNPRSPSNTRAGAGARINIDGSVRDEDVFVLEDEDEDGDSDLETVEGTPSRGPETTSVKAAPEQDKGSESIESKPLPVPQEADAPAEDGRSMSSKYFIRPDDTLLGISLKFGVDGRVLCRLNNLPASTLRTTPHLLHTRSYLILPPSSCPPPVTPAEQALDNERRARLALDRAHNRFQSMTKETDRDVAKAYIALAGLPDHEPLAGDAKESDKEQGLRKRKTYMPEAGLGESSLEGRAVDQYFDDDEEWEARERAEGRKVIIPSFPLFGRADKQPAGEQKSWWRWRS